MHLNRDRSVLVEDYIATKVPAADLLNALNAVTRLNSDFGTWQTPWGQINRYQRINDDIAQPFNDSAPGIPVPFTSSVWGSLASFGARPIPAQRSGTAPAATASLSLSSSARASAPAP